MTSYFDQGEHSIGQNQVVNRYRGIEILCDPDDGYYAETGTESFGYADSIEDIQTEIDDYMSGPDDSRARQAIGW